MIDFRARADAFLAEFLALHPTAATLIGEHAYDAQWPDMSAAGRRDRIAFADRWLAEFRGFTDLPADDAVDRDLLVQQLDAMRFAELDLREEAWSPLEWVYLLGGGLFGLVSREFAPLAERLASVAGRLDGFEAVVDAAIEEIGPVGDRPVARFHTEKALEQLPGVIELADEALTMAEQAEAEDPAVAAVLPRLRASTERARGEMERFERHLREEVLPRSEGEGRLGAGLFAREDAPHDAFGRVDARADPRTGGARLRRRPCRDGSDRDGAVADLVPGHRTARRRTAAGARGPRRDRRRSPAVRASCSSSAGKSSSGWRRSAASAT